MPMKNPPSGQDKLRYGGDEISRYTVAVRACDRQVILEAETRGAGETGMVRSSL